MNSIFKTIPLLMILVVAFSACNKPAETASTEVKANESENVDKIVYINIDTLINKYDFYQDNKNDLEEQSKIAEKSLVGKIESYQKRKANFQKEIYDIQQRANTIAPVELQKMEEKFGKLGENLAKEEEALMKQRESVAMDLDAKLQEMLKTIQDKLDIYLAKVAEEKGYDLVLMKGAGGSVMFGRPTLDITEDTVKNLNEEYAATKTDKEDKK